MTGTGPASHPGLEQQALAGLMGDLLNLSNVRTLEDMLSKLLGGVTRTFQAEAGSILLQTQTQALKLVRSGVFRPQALKRIEYWEEVIGHRLEKQSWRINDSENLPVSVSRLSEPDLILINVPLVSKTQMVIGSLSLVFPTNYHLTTSHQEMLKSVSVGVGHVADLFAELKTAQQRLRQMELFYQVGQALMTTLDLNTLLAETMRLATEVIDAGAASLMLIDRNNEELVFEVSLGSRGHVLRQQRIPLDEGIAGWVARHGEPSISNNARTDPRFSHRVDVRTGFLTQSIAAVPLKTKGCIIGVLEVLNKYSESGFEEEDLRIMSVIAAQAAIAIENARLYQEVRQERDNILKAQEDVRHELNRKLHDGPVQLLSAISLSVDHLERLNNVKPDVRAGAIQALRNLINQTIREARSILFELRPVILETQGVVSALRQYIDRLQDNNDLDGLTLHFDTVEQVTLDKNVAGIIFSIVQEALNNVKRHAHAKNMWLTLENRNDYLIVTVKDDGRGFEMLNHDEIVNDGRFGLLNMSERAALIEADLQINTNPIPPNQGTTIQLILPLASDSGVAGG